MSENNNSKKPEEDKKAQAAVPPWVENAPASTVNNKASEKAPTAVRSDRNDEFSLKVLAQYICNKRPDSLGELPQEEDAAAQPARRVDDRDDPNNNKRNKGRRNKRNKKKNNKKRPRDERLPNFQKICLAIIKGDECPYGDSCKFSHDLQAYLRTRPQDICAPAAPATCPNWEETGYCLFGATCRFGSCHFVKATGENLRKTEGVEAPPPVQNFLPKEILLQLRKRSYPFRCAQKNGGKTRNHERHQEGKKAGGGEDKKKKQIDDNNRMDTTTTDEPTSVVVKKEEQGEEEEKKEEDDNNNNNNNSNKMDTTTNDNKRDSVIVKKEEDENDQDDNKMDTSTTTTTTTTTDNKKTGDSVVVKKEEDEKKDEDDGRMDTTTTTTTDDNNKIGGSVVLVKKEEEGEDEKKEDKDDNKMDTTTDDDKTDNTVVVKKEEGEEDEKKDEENDNDKMDTTTDDSKTGHSTVTVKREEGQENEKNEDVETTKKEPTSATEVEVKKEDVEMKKESEVEVKKEATTTRTTEADERKKEEEATSQEEKKEEPPVIKPIIDPFRPSLNEYNSNNTPLPNKTKRTIDFSNKVYVAPLTTVGNLPFRRIMKKFGADITCGEMALAGNLLEGKPSEWALLKRHPSEDVFGVQIASGYPDQFTRVAEVIEQHCEIDFLDMNLGCPLDIICQKGAGASLMLRHNRLRGILSGVTSTLSCPVTVKMRTGWDQDRPFAHQLVARIQSWGIDGIGAIMVHGRSRLQRYQNLANWDYISKVCKSQDDALPQLHVIGNGDILSYTDYEERIQKEGISPAAMLGRGALIKPWLPTEIKERRHWDISATERLDILKDFVRFGLTHWGSDDQGVNNTRRFLLEWQSFLCRYVPVGILEGGVPQKMNMRPPAIMCGRNDLETLMLSPHSHDWIKISEMLLGPVPDGFRFEPKHKAKSYKDPQG